jgi:hypothetical protein
MTYRRSRPRAPIVGDGVWQAVGGKRPCDGCHRKLVVDDVQAINTHAGLVFCGDCWPAWAESIPRAVPGGPRNLRGATMERERSER